MINEIVDFGEIKGLNINFTIPIELASHRNKLVNMLKQMMLYPDSLAVAKYYGCSYSHANIRLSLNTIRDIKERCEWADAHLRGHWVLGSYAMPLVTDHVEQTKINLRWQNLNIDMSFCLYHNRSHMEVTSANAQVPASV